MDNHLYRIIRPPHMITTGVAPTDEIALPPDATAIDPDDWQAMITVAGDEQTLLDELGITHYETQP